MSEEVDGPDWIRLAIEGSPEFPKAFHSLISRLDGDFMPNDEELRKAQEELPEDQRDDFREAVEDWERDAEEDN